MFKFSHFKKIIKEELSDEQKKSVANWKRDLVAVAATDHYFGKGNDDVHHQLVGTQDKSEVHKAIERHLGKEIEIPHYKEGLTTDNYGRQVKIGRLIKDEGLRNQFANDSTRQGKKFTGLSVHVTRSPAGVCGQTSGSQSWKDESCKNFETGSNRRYLQDEVEHGTVVGYLKDHKGKEISRITLQPHINDEGHRAYAINGHYGIDHEDFKQHMQNVASDLSGEYKDKIYNIHPKVYNDNNEETILHPKTNNEHISHILSYGTSDEKTMALNHPNINSKNIDKALNDKNINIRHRAIYSPNASEENLTKALNDKMQHVRKAALSHKKITPDHLNIALSDNNLGIRYAAIQHPKITSENIHKALDDSDDDIREIAIKHKNATSENIHKALDDKNSSIRVMAILHKNASKENINKALKDSSYIVRGAALDNSWATDEHYKKALNDPHEMVRNAAKWYISKEQLK
jgi:hypothetical protein